MSDASPEPLVNLVGRARAAMWRQRILQSVWYGVCTASLFLLIAAVVHLKLFAVPARVWLWLASGPPVIAALFALFWNRPSEASAAVLLDRLGDHNQLLTTAWEALTTPSSRQSAAFPVVLRQAVALSSRVELPLSRIVTTSWQGPRSVTPWAVMAIAAFCLQLPVDHRELTIAGANADDSGVAPKLVPAIAVQAMGGAGTTPEEPGVALAPGAEGAAPRGSPLLQGAPNNAEKAVNGITTVQTEQKPSLNLSLDSVPGDGKMLSADTAPPELSDGGGQIDAVTESTSVSLQGGQYTRDSTTASRLGVAGTGGNELATTPGGASSAVPITATPAPARPGAVPYSNRFSVVQRLQIKAYFDHLEK